MLQGPRVLVVDEVSDTEEVLRAVLEPRGMQVDRVRSERPASNAIVPLPAVVVIDAEKQPVRLRHSQEWKSVPQVIIGSALFEDGAAAESGAAARRYLRKPFQYSELVQAIEHIVGRQTIDRKAA